MAEKKADVVLGNPTIAKQENGLYTVVYAEPPFWTIQKFVDLTYSELRRLPFVKKETFQYLK